MELIVKKFGNGLHIVLPKSLFSCGAVVNVLTDSENKLLELIDERIALALAKNDRGV